MLAWWRREWGTPLQRAVVLGGLLGLAAGIRPQLAPLGLLVLEDAWRRPEDRPPTGRCLAAGSRGLAVAAPSGSALDVRGGIWGGYASQTSHHLRAFLLSPYHGALVWSPLLVVGLAGLVWAVLRSASCRVAARHPLCASGLARQRHARHRPVRGAGHPHLVGRHQLWGAEAPRRVAVAAAGLPRACRGGARATRREEGSRGGGLGPGGPQRALARRGVRRPEHDRSVARLAGTLRRARAAVVRLRLGGRGGGSSGCP